MSLLNYKAYTPAAILLAGCALLWQTHSQEAVPLSAPLATVLAEVKGFEVTDQEISPEEQRIAGMTTYSARSFRRDGALAFTTLVSYYDRQSKGKTIHSPRNCLPGAGWEIVSGGPHAVVVNGASHTVNR